MDRCPNCREETSPGMRYCPRCGAQLPGGASPPRGGPASPFDTGSKLTPEQLEALGAREPVIWGAEWIRRGWRLFKEDPGAYIGFTALAFVGLGIVSAIPMGGPLVALASGPLWAGFYAAGLERQKKGRPPDFADFFSGFKRFLPLMLGGLLTGLFITAGLILLVVPGIYLAVAYLFPLPLILDRGIDFWQAMELSRRVVTRRWFSFFGFALLLFLVNLAGALVVLVGLLVSVPVSFLAIAAAYLDVFGAGADTAPLGEAVPPPG
jgi:hypothetical protein